jgi:hypothetical protein
MNRDWIREGLRSEPEREQQRRLMREERRRHKKIIEEKGPDLTRELVAEITAAVEQFHAESGLDRGAMIFEPLPHEGFRVERSVPPRVTLECRPSYDAGCIYCNTTREDDIEPEARELAFVLRFEVTGSSLVRLRHGDRAFGTVGEIVEFLLAPVLFPPVETPPY